MKNNTIALILLVVSLFAACKKKEENNSMRFMVNNVSDVFINQYTDTTIFLMPEIEYLSGDQEPVTLSLSGLPDGVTAEQTSIIGYPTYAVRIPLYCYAKSEGSYPITLTAKGVKSGTQTLVFNLNIKGRSCPQYAGLVGYYTANVCGEHFRTIAVLPNILNVVVESFYNPTISFIPDCSNNTHMINTFRRGTIKGEANISGKLTHTQRKIYIEWYLDYDNPNYNNDTCIETLTKE